MQQMEDFFKLETRTTLQIRLQFCLLLWYKPSRNLKAQSANIKFINCYNGESQDSKLEFYINKYTKTGTQANKGSICFTAVEGGTSICIYANTGHFNHIYIFSKTKNVFAYPN